jgi:hypothetical protein
MNCLGCERETIETAWGNWCDPCGGVVIGQPPILFFRHVATMSGPTGHYPIVFDVSSNSYGVAWPRKTLMVTCIHCGLQTPGDDTRNGLKRLDDLRTQQFYSKRGTLDEILAWIQPIARGDGPDMPELAPAPSATEIEVKRFNVG